ncbi:MAG TPA: hypothetical protein VFM43_08345 [Gaiellaceae bacterium]|nr:hypothetical protein [Gaiellaceae bacterium]
MDKRTESSATRADVNRHLRMAVKSFDLPEESEETWDFLCECGAEGCEEWVTLPIAEFEAVRLAGKPLLAPGHRADPVRRTRRDARRLVEEARALRAQAEHQVRRAVRNLVKARPS